MEAIDFKGKLILSGGQDYDAELGEFKTAAKKAGYS